MPFIKLIVLLVLSTTVQTVFSQENKFVKAANCFSLNLMQKMQPPNKNSIMSAFSVDTVLSMLMIGARGTTADELNSVLQNEANDLSIGDVIQGFRSIMTSLTSNTDVTVSIANAMWIDQDYTVKQDYKKVIQETFMADQRSGNFKRNSAKATDDINAWVKDKTKSMIDKLFDEPLDPATIIVLLNAIYFKGEWLYKFDKAKTKSEVFYNGGDKTKPKMVDFMTLKTALNFQNLPEINATALRLDYKGESMSFVAILPDEGVGLAYKEDDGLCGSLGKPPKFPFPKRLVDVKLPKFQITWDMDLVDALKALQLKRVFRNGDLSGIGPGGLSVTKVVQKAKIKVNEEGSEAAVITGAPGKSAEVKFWANRPFSYFIIDKNSGLILFGGKLTNF